MDLANCSAKHVSKSCCGHETGIDSGSCDHIYASLVECNSKGINNEEVPANVKPVTITPTNKCNEDLRKKAASSWSTNSKIPARQPSPVLAYKMSGEVDEAFMSEVTRSPYRLSHDADFQCPRCGRRMEEPRLLPCLHPICLPCVYELMNIPLYVPLGSDIRDYSRTYATIGVRETCLLCDSYLPSVNSPVPPPHYPLQHRLVMDTVRRKLVNRVLCDTCAAEVPALIQCSTCLRNFCSECGRQHEQQNIAEARTTKHLMRPLWEATKVRRTILCQTHPIHALRFYCIACQQVTCKECMWSIQHRGHASEDAVGVGKRAGVYLTTMLQRARIVLNNLLTQYNHDVFSNNAFEESQNIAKSYRYTERSAEDGPNLWDYNILLYHVKQAQERIQEFDRLRRARHLLDAISLVNDLLADDSEIEILTLAGMIVRRLNKLGVMNVSADREDEYWYRNAKLSASRLTHNGIYHCCTFCSSGGRKEVTCGCRGTMPGGYRGCGHGHVGHPGVNHWSCCGSILRNGRCLIMRKPIHQLMLTAAQSRSPRVRNS